MFAKLNGNKILLAVFAKVQEHESNALSLICNFGYILNAELKINFWKFFIKI